MCFSHFLSLYFNFFVVTVTLYKKKYLSKYQHFSVWNEIRWVNNNKPFFKLPFLWTTCKVSFISKVNGFIQRWHGWVTDSYWYNWKEGRKTIRFSSVQSVVHTSFYLKPHSGVPVTSRLILVLWQQQHIVLILSNLCKSSVRQVRAAELMINRRFGAQVSWD